MAKINSTTMSKFGTTYDLNAINNLALKAGVKPLTVAQVKSMTPEQIQTYLKAGREAGKIIASTIRKSGRQFRKNAKFTASENYKQAQLMHGTIRQGIAELGTLGAQGIAQNAITKAIQSPSAIQQNTDGGTVDMSSSSGEGNGSTEKGPVYAHRGRREE